MEKLHWEASFDPIKIFGNLYFLGTQPASVHVVDTGDGLIMFDAGYQQSLYVVIDNFHRMGLNPRDVKYILLTHGHIDHMGAARSMKALSGAKIALGRADEEYANGILDLSYAKELGMTYDETFAPDILLSDGDVITLGNTSVRAVATPGHTPGAMSYFFPVSDGTETLTAGLHGGAGLNTLRRSFLDKYNLPYTLREDYKRSMLRLSEEKVDIFLGSHMKHNRTAEKCELVKGGNPRVFVDPTEWKAFNLRCVQKLEKKIAQGL